MIVTNISIAPSTCSHLRITATIGGQVRTIETSAPEVQLSPGETEEIRLAVIRRIRSFQLENNYTLAQLRANLPGKVFEI